MALTASPTLVWSTSKVEIRSFQPQICLPLRGCRQISPACSMKEHFGDLSKVKLQLSVIKEKLWEVTPDSVKSLPLKEGEDIILKRLSEATPGSVKSFPWKQGKDTVLARLSAIGLKALKWSLIILYIGSFLSDIISSIVRNQELMVPFGLFVGCLMTDYFKEVAQEMVQTTEENGSNLALQGIICFFALVKIISSYFYKGQTFLLHVSNGGLLQALWLWRNARRQNFEGNEKTSVTGHDT